MKRSKKIFLIAAVIFFVMVIFVGYDISRKTTFPGSKKLLRESLAPSDSVKSDTVNTEGEKK